MNTKNQIIKSMFEHCKLRAKERYAFDLTRPDYDTMSLTIRNKENLGTNILLFKESFFFCSSHFIP